MKHQQPGSWHRRGLLLLALAALLLLAVWAPVPGPWQIVFRFGLLAVLYAAMLTRIMIDAVRSSMRDTSRRSRHRMAAQQHEDLRRAATPRTVPLTPVQHHYLEAMAESQLRQAEESHQPPTASR
jgi:hypothetical protein